jgi:hypothetical protein
MLAQRALRYRELGSDRRKATPYCRGLCQLGEPEEDIRRSVRGARYTQAVTLGGKVCPLSGFRFDKKGPRRALIT